MTDSPSAYLRVHEPREDGVAADVVAAQVDRHRLRQPQDAGLRHPVRGVLRPRALGVHAGGRDDGAATALPHLGVDIKVILTTPCIFCINNY